MTIPNRDDQHGGMEAVGSISQRLKDVLRTGANWQHLSNAQREALDMMMHKVARIMSGDLTVKDHWIDAGGYPLCIARQMEDE